MRVCGFQMAVTRDVDQNTRAILGAIRHAADQGADVLLTPEGSLSGYTPRFDPRKVQEALERVCAAAREARVGLALGTCYVEPDDGRCYDQLRFYNRSGTFLGYHAKILLCGTPGDLRSGEICDFATAPLRTFGFEGMCVGGLICNDLWANPECTPMDDPHLVQKLAEMGARVVFHAVNGGRNGGPWSRVAWAYHESNLRLRARASRVWIVTVDSSHPVHLLCSAPSGILTPEGEWFTCAEPQGEQYFIGDLPL